MQAPGTTTATTGGAGGAATGTGATGQQDALDKVCPVFRLNDYAN